MANSDEVEAGKYRSRLSLMAPGKPEDGIRDTFGQVTSAPGTVRTVWGMIEAVSGGEFEQAAELQVVITHRAEIRRPSGLEIGKDWQVASGGKIYNVEYARPLGNRRRKLELMLREMMTT